MNWAGAKEKGSCSGARGRLHHRTNFLCWPSGDSTKGDAHRGLEARGGHQERAISPPGVPWASPTRGDIGRHRTLGPCWPSARCQLGGALGRGDRQSVYVTNGVINCATQAPGRQRTKPHHERGVWAPHGSLTSTCVSTVGRPLASVGALPPVVHRVALPLGSHLGPNWRTRTRVTWWTRSTPWDLNITCAFGTRGLGAMTHNMSARLRTFPGRKEDLAFSHPSSFSITPSSCRAVHAPRVEPRETYA